MSNGLFTVVLDFGANFPGANRWLEIAVATNGAAVYTTLVPRQAVTPVPYAIFSETIATNTIATANLQNGAVSGAKLAVPLNLSGSTATGGIVSGNNAGNGDGLSGSSSGGRGVVGFTTSAGAVIAGVWGENSATNGTAVVGKSTAPTGTGVYGESAGSGYGVAGSSSSGYGVSGSSTTSYGVYGISSTTTSPDSHQLGRHGGLPTRKRW